MKRAEANAKYSIYMAISRLLLVPIAIVNQTVITTKINLQLALQPSKLHPNCKLILPVMTQGVPIKILLPKHMRNWHMFPTQIGRSLGKALAKSLLTSNLEDVASRLTTSDCHICRSIYNSMLKFSAVAMPCCVDQRSWVDLVLLACCPQRIDHIFSLSRLTPVMKERH